MNFEELETKIRYHIYIENHPFDSKAVVGIKPDEYYIRGYVLSYYQGQLDLINNSSLSEREKPRLENLKAELKGMALPERTKSYDTIHSSYLCKAIKEDNFELFEIASANGADVNYNESGRSFSDCPLILAAKKNTSDRYAYQMADRLLSHRDINVNYQNDSGDTPLLVIARKALRPEEEKVILPLAAKLIQRGANVNVERVGQERAHHPHETPLMCAAEVGNVGIVELLINNGAGVSTKIPYRGTALSYAVQSVPKIPIERRLAIVKKLKNAGAVVGSEEKLAIKKLKNELKQAQKVESENESEIGTTEERKDVIAIEAEISRLQKNGESWFSIGNNKKANRLEKALSDATNKVGDVRQDDAVVAVLRDHRICGFFGLKRTTTTTNIDAQSKEEGSELKMQQS